tara:strand:+ start:187 stop:309 length:123 start_codon:yes stop_codon:yes gene_type:complete
MAKKFKTHMMYKKGEKPVKVDTKTKHDKLKKEGYGHKKPK